MKKLLIMFFAWVTPLAAQVTITEAPLTTDAAASIVALYNRAEGIRLSGDSRIASGTETDGSVAVLAGSLTLGGRVRGDLVVINGDLIAEPGAQVDGSITIVGGAVEGAQNLRARELLKYPERLKYELRDGVLLLMREVPTDELAAGREFRFGRTDLVVAARGGYNRSEGLPVFIGPRLTLGRRNPTRLEALVILRTAAGFEFNENDYGYVLTAEQFVGGKQAARLGFRYASEVLPVEAWGLSDRETSLAAFVLHRDYRDHYARAGWSTYLAAGRGGLPLDWRIEFGNLEYENAVLRDPFSLLHNHQNWRREVLVPAVRMRTLGLHTKYDTRNENRDPSSGWLVRGDAELGLSLRSGTAATFDQDYRYGLLDIRRYARLSPSSRISLRAVAAGSINGNALPSFHQQALGGEGSLPGYELYDFDCGAHSAIAVQQYSPYYGCDRLLFFQVEYQSNFRWLSRMGRNVGRDFGLLDNIKWLLFFDTGRTWTEQASVGNRATGLNDFVADAGFGLRFGTIGAYWAVPLSARGQGVNFFMRLGPRL
ncbi:MAG: BamA/TamA family outer membrane protein [Gemmatimonadota bacterium]